MDEAQMGDFVHMLVSKYGMDLESAVKVAQNMGQSAPQLQPAPAPTPASPRPDAELDKMIQDVLATPQARKAGPPTMEQALKESEGQVPPANPMAARIAAVRHSRYLEKLKTERDAYQAKKHASVYPAPSPTPRQNYTPR